MRKVALVSGLLVVCSLTVALAGEKAAKHSVTIKDMKFDPDTLEIAPGQTVVWTNQDDRDHTVSAKDGSFKSDNLSKGDTFEHVFKKAGKFSYACSYHPRMKGTIVVKGD
jgi:plastocyanin